jgi:hypothetical protein
LIELVHQSDTCRNQALLPLTLPPGLSPLLSHLVLFPIVFAIVIFRIVIFFWIGLNTAVGLLGFTSVCAVFERFVDVGLDLTLEYFTEISEAKLGTVLKNWASFSIFAFLPLLNVVHLLEMEL